MVSCHSSIAALALLGTALIASSDEFHQSFLPNRTASPWDVLIDCSGAITMQVLVYFFLRWFRPGMIEHRQQPGCQITD